jgi:hypothetical protein
MKYRKKEQIKLTEPQRVWDSNIYVIHSSKEKRKKGVQR